jgi:hypothetical protein
MGIAVIVTAVLKTAAFITGGRIPNDVHAETRARGRAGLVHWLAALGLVGTVVLLVATIGSTMAVR